MSEDRSTRKRRVMMSCSAIIVAAFLDVAMTHGSDLNSNTEITSEIVGRTVTWQITNRGDVPIVRIQIPIVGAAEPMPPKGWDYEISESSIHAWSNDHQSEIRRGVTRGFTVTSGANGGRPGLATAELTLANDRIVRVDNVISFRNESWLTVALPPAAICLLGLILVLRRRGERSQPQQS